MKDLEIRHFTGLEVRASDSDRKMSGYAAVFNSESVDFGWFREQIAVGAFTRTLKENKDIRALADHDTAKVLARTKAGTLSLREDSNGLWADIEAGNTSYGNDCYECVKRGDVDGMSFGFRVVRDAWETRDGKDFRTLLDVDLIEVSIVAFPAYPESSVSARSAEAAYKEHLAKSGKNLKLAKMKLALLNRLG